MQKHYAYRFIYAIVALSLILICPMALAAETNLYFNFNWAIPFLGLLLSLIFLPLKFPHLWQHHIGKIVSFWTASLLIPYAISFGNTAAAHFTLHILLSEYLPFIILLGTLYIISGGILIEINLPPHPLINTSVLAVGTLLAGIMGTTGAATLLIHPLIRINKNRQYRAHIIIFFIFLVANIGGGLTPLGDPPLFIGLLKGIHFSWTVRYMYKPVLLTGGILLTIFYIVDQFFYRKEPISKITLERAYRLNLGGLINFGLILGVVLTIFCLGTAQCDYFLPIIGIKLPASNLLRDILLIILAGLSLKLTPKTVRITNGFKWEPIAEVAKLFAAIFITVSPILTLLAQAKEGSGFIVNLLHTAQGVPIASRYFWIPGLLSSFLDNAPTYLIFFMLAAGGESAQMMGPLAPVLLALSMGTVFMGAITYLGNAPNLIVKNITEHHHIEMPSFFGYMRWSVGILIPIFLLLTLLFF